MRLARVRALRANPPGLAAGDADRRDVFGAALEQFEQLLRAAEVSGPASAPLPLFYALSQAGRAIAAARLNDPAEPERWNYIGHGLGGAKNYSSPIGSVPVRPAKGNTEAFQVVSEATGSSPLLANRPLELGELWASLPLTQTGEGLGADLPRPITLREHIHPTWGALTCIEAPMGPDADVVSAVSDLLALYPAANGHRQLSQALPRPGWVRAEIYWPDAQPPGTVGPTSRPLREMFDSYWSDSTFYLRPAVGGQRAPSILMTWWAVLFALSHLARYAPAVWTAAISPDSSVLTVPIEDGLRSAKRGLPRLVYHGITGSWD